MAQVKLLFPSLANAGGIFSSIAPHTALLTVILPEDQTNDTIERDCFHFRSPKFINWVQMSVSNMKPLMFDQEKIKSLSFCAEEENDYE